AVGTATTDADGVATLTGVSLAGIGAGTHVTYVGAAFAEDSGYFSGSGTGDLIVGKAALTVTANPASMVYGATDPSLSYTPSGTLYYGDTYSVIAGVSLSTTTGAAATAGSHPIVASGGVAANYTITDVDGTLTVSKASLTVTADPTSKVYGAADPT